MIKQLDRRCVQRKHDSSAHATSRTFIQRSGESVRGGADACVWHRRPYLPHLFRAKAHFFVSQAERLGLRRPILGRSSWAEALRCLPVVECRFVSFHLL